MSSFLFYQSRALNLCLIFFFNGVLEDGLFCFRFMFPFLALRCDLSFSDDVGLIDIGVFKKKKIVGTDL